MQAAGAPGAVVSVRRWQVASAPHAKEVLMFDHIGLRVKDLDASVRFYTAALGSLGYEVTTRDESSASFGAQGTHCLWLSEDAKLAHSLVHIAFTARGRAAVDGFHREGLKTGGRDNGSPGVRKDYSPSYYAAFLFDPDGNNVEAVCLE
jgi:catechol 2,3-dioxygenase-like lactoylglutathione lyase family enzyme